MEKKKLIIKFEFASEFNLPNELLHGRSDGTMPPVFEAFSKLFRASHFKIG